MSALPRLTAGEQQIVADAASISPLLREASAEIDSARQLPAHIVRALHGSGCFRMTLPVDEGGLEAGVPAQIQVIEEISSANGSAGWCVMIGSANNHFLSYLEPATARAMAPTPETVIAAALFPSGRAERVPGGYRVTGRWPFASGITHSRWAGAGADVYENGKPSLRANGMPLKLHLFAPVEDVQVFDTWDTFGMRGSGSHDFAMDDLFIPEERTYDPIEGAMYRTGPLYSFRGILVVGHPGVPIGLSRGATEACIGLVREKPGKFGARPKDQPSVQLPLAEAYALAESARSFVYDTATAFWEALLEGRQPSAEEQTRLRIANTYAHDAAQRAIGGLYNVAGSTAVYLPNPLERFLRDAQVARQHVIASTMMLEGGGRSLLSGRPPA